MLLGSLTGYVLARVLPATYASSAALEWTGTERAPVASPTGEIPAATPTPALLFEQALTPDRLAAVAARSGFNAPPAEMRRHLVVERSPRSVTVSFSAGDARLAQTVCANIVSLLMEESRGGNKEAAAATGTRSAQVQNAKRKWEQQGARLAEFKRRHAGQLDVASQAAAEEGLMEKNAQLEDAKAALSRAEENKRLTEALLQQQLAAWRRAPVADTRPLEQELAAKQAEQAELETRYTPSHPDVVKLKNDIARLRKKLDAARATAATKQGSGAAPQAEPAQIAETRAQLLQLDRTIEEKTRERQRLEQEIQAAGSRQAADAALAREYELLTTSYNTAEADYEALAGEQTSLGATGQATQGRSEPALRITEPPSLPAKPSYPDPVRFTLGGGAGGLMAAALAILAGAWSSKTRWTEADVERYLRLPTLAVIPTTGVRAGRAKEEARGTGRKGGGGTREERILADV
jgi:uncharacterized protein involved in exopolysaccharide biosynthesis